MEALPQNLKKKREREKEKRTISQNNVNKKEGKIEFAQVHYLDELVEMTTHKLTRRQA